MEKGNINVIIFDEEEPSMKEHRDSRTVVSSKQAMGASSQHIEIIEQEIGYLTDKIRTLQQQADSLAQLKNESNSNCKQSNNTIDISAGHSQEILIAIEKKIQVVVRETRRIVERLGETFEKKLQARISKKYEDSGVSKIKESYFTAVRKIEEGYKQEIERMNREHKQAEGKMISRVGAIEQKLINRMNDYEVKEKEYVDWIHHLEIQLKERPERQQKPKSRKMIEVTHAPSQPERGNPRREKEPNEDSSVITSMTGDNIPSGLNHQKSSSQINDSSKIQRRHRIFDGVGAKTSSSVSPNTKVVSPISVQPNPHNSHNSKVVNPISRQPAQRNTESHQPQKPNLVIDRATEPLKNNFTNDRESSPWRAMDKSDDKIRGEVTRRNLVVKDENEDEFYKDLPKASGGWERFQDYQENEDSSSDSEGDVVFYRNEEKSEEVWTSQNDPQYSQNDPRSSQNDPRSSQNDPRSSQNDQIWRNTGHNQASVGSRKPEGRGEQRVFSPFDLN